MLWWQAPTLLNPHFATGTKDQDASRIFYEPLAGFDPDGNVVPVLAAETPSQQNGGLARDLTSVTWKLKKGVTWHDGKPLTADDVVFTYEFVSDPATAAVTSGSYHEIAKIDKVDSHTVKLTFNKPQPFWADPFCGTRGAILPKHVFESFKGAKSREAPANLRPVGTLRHGAGPDVLRYARRREYQQPATAPWPQPSRSPAAVRLPARRSNREE